MTFRSDDRPCITVMNASAVIVYSGTSIGQAATVLEPGTVFAKGDDLEESRRACGRAWFEAYGSESVVAVVPGGDLSTGSDDV